MLFVELLRRPVSGGLRSIAIAHSERVFGEHAHILANIHDATIDDANIHDAAYDDAAYDPPTNPAANPHSATDYGSTGQSIRPCGLSGHIHRCRDGQRPLAVPVATSGHPHQWREHRQLYDACGYQR